MFTKKEMLSIALISVVLGVVVSLVSSISAFFLAVLFVFIVLMINILTKKIVGYYLDTDIEIKIWEMQQFGPKKHMRARKPIAMGIFAPLIIKFISVGLINWMATMTFEASGKVYRSARRHGIYSFSEVSEEEIGWIAAAGIAANIIFAIVAYLIGQGELARISITYAFFNMIPLFNWDGAKVFFGSIPIWSTLAVISSLGIILSLVTL